MTLKKNVKHTMNLLFKTILLLDALLDTPLSVKKKGKLIINLCIAYSFLQNNLNTFFIKYLTGACNY